MENEMISVLENGRLRYDSGVRIVEPSKLNEADLRQRFGLPLNLSVGTESVGSLETFQNIPPRVRDSSVGESRLRRCAENQTPHCSNYVHDDIDNRNPGNECVIDRTITNRVRVIVPSWSRIRLPTVSLLEVKSSLDP